MKVVLQSEEISEAVRLYILNDPLLKKKFVNKSVVISVVVKPSLFGRNQGTIEVEAN